MEGPGAFERVLVGVDSRGLAAHAVARGLELAAGQSARLRLLHAAQRDSATGGGASGEASEALARERAKTLASLSPVLARTGHGERRVDELLEVVPGCAHELLLEALDERDADLLLVGEHDRRPPFEFGSTFQALLSAATVPIWIQVEPVRPIERILVAVDFSEHSRLALNCAAALARRFGSRLGMLHCYKPPRLSHASASDAIPGPAHLSDREGRLARERLERLTDEQVQAGLDAQPVFVEGKAAKHIVARAEEADLIVMGTHGRTSLSRSLLGSVTHDVLAHTRRAALVVPCPGRAFEVESGGRTERPSVEIPNPEIPNPVRFHQ